MLIWCTGVGALCSTATNVHDFDQALREGRSGAVAAEHPLSEGLNTRTWAPLEVVWSNGLKHLSTALPDQVDRASRLLRRSPCSLGAGVVAALQAVSDAELIDKPPGNTAIIVAGGHQGRANVGNATGIAKEQPAFVSPRLALTAYDSHLAGVMSEVLQIESGLGMHIGAASASSNMAIVTGLLALRAGACERCLVVAGLEPLGPAELLAFRKIGALVDERFDAIPSQASRPFDRQHAGFVYGQGAAALVLEKAESAQQRGVTPRGALLGFGTALSASHLPSPSSAAAARAMRAALQDAARTAGVETSDFSYVSAHATSTPLGDIAELEAINHVFGECSENIIVNATKSLIGHCLSAAGALECVATLLQLNGGYVHGNINLVDPPSNGQRLVQTAAQPHAADFALSNSFAFGGIHSTLAVAGARPTLSLTKGMRP